MSSFGDMDSPGFGGSGGPGNDGTRSGHGNSELGAADNAALQEFIAVEQQRAELRSAIQMLTDICWDKCIDKTGHKLDGKQETCLDNCVGRFVDVSILITQRFTTALQRNLK